VERLKAELEEALKAVTRLKMMLMKAGRRDI
jgi:hypothetical protein